MRNSFEYYQQLLADMVEHPEVVTEEDITDISSASKEELGELAFSSLTALDRYWDTMVTGAGNRLTHKLFMEMVTGLAGSSGFTYERFAYIAAHGSFFALLFALLNKYYPVSLLIDYDYTQDDDSHFNDLKLMGYSSFQDMLEKIRGDRLEDVLAYLREGEPGLENLSDDMVLGVSGVTVSKR